MDQSPLSGLLTTRDLIALTRLSRTSIYRMTRQGRFPPSLSLGNGHIRWRAEDVHAWLAALPAQSVGKKAHGSPPPSTGRAP